MKLNKEPLEFLKFQAFNGPESSASGAADAPNHYSAYIK